MFPKALCKIARLPAHVFLFSHHQKTATSEEEYGSCFIRAVKLIPANTSAYVQWNYLDSSCALTVKYLKALALRVYYLVVF